MGATSSAIVIHSSNVQEDREALVAIFPDRFQIEKHDHLATEALQWEDQLTLILVSSNNTTAKGTYATMTLEDEEIRQAADRATMVGVKIQNFNRLSGVKNVMVKLYLPGGATILLSTADTWKSQDLRNVAIVNLLAPYYQSPLCSSERRQESPRRRQQRDLAMQRSTSMPEMVSMSESSANHRLFPALRVRVLTEENKLETFPLNTETGIPIETDLFVGKLLLVMRPANPEDDTYWNERIFAKKKRRVLMQLQGKLKYKPKGELYSGMEISDPMRLGLLASGLCNFLLKMISKFNSQMHYSFGDDKERPHICFPASTFFEDLIITPEGETPPPLGTEFEEDPDTAAKRKAYKTKIDWNTKDTYSMSFHSMYIDFPSWSIVRLPIGRDLDLQTFWGNSTASVVLYEVEDASKQHLTKSLKYLASIEMKFLGKGAETEDLSEGERASDTDASEDRFVEVDFDSGSISTNGEAHLLPPIEDDEDDDDLEFFDTVQSQSLLPASLDKGLTDISAASSHAALMRLIDKFCPCVIDMIGRKGKYSHVYSFLNVQNEKRSLFRHIDVSQDLLGDRYVTEVDDSIFSQRLSVLERKRREIGLRYAEAMAGRVAASKMKHFQIMVSYHDKNFMRHNSVPQKPSIKSGLLARALSDRHWIEEFGCLADGEIQFYRLDKGKPHFCISLSSIVKVEPLPEAEWPLLSGYVFLSIESFGRTTCLMLESAEELHSWVEAILDHRPRPEVILQSVNSLSNHLIEVDEPSAEFLRESSMWDCSKRKLLNCRKYSFRTPPTTCPEQTNSTVETALRKATALEPKGPEDADLIEFLNCTSALKEVDVHALSEQERLAFFLNVYHVMICHAFLVLGPPDSSLKWLSYFNCVAYLCADDIFSLAELEHNIIRAKMAFPSQFLSRFVLPKSEYNFALTKPDARINFALNCGSLSIPTSSVPVYKASTLQEQLDRITRDFLAKTVSIKPKGSKDVSIILPRVCQWFADDFGDSGGAADVLKAIESYLSSDQQRVLNRIWNDRKQSYDIGLFMVKYSAYNFDCRFLTLEEDNESQI